MRALGITCVTWLMTTHLHAQIPTFQWAARWGSTARDVATDVALDATGNTVLVGTFVGSIDGDPGAGTSTLVGPGGDDAFVVKLDPQGAHVWSYAFGGGLQDKGMAVAFSPVGDVVVVGLFSGTVDFDPGPGSFMQTSNGNQDVFILKLAADGTLIWARNVGSIYSDECYTADVDGDGNVFVTGLVSEAADLDPGPANYPFAIGNFVLKLDPSGQFLWALHPFTSGGNVFGACLNATGELYLTGWAGTADFDPGPAELILQGFGGGGDIFVSKLDGDGALAWARLLGGPGTEQGYAIAVDGNDNAYITGSFNSGCNFDPFFSDSTLTTVNGADAFTMRLDADGTFAWVFQVGGTTFSADEGFGIAVDELGLVYITGEVLGITDMDPGAGTYTLNTGNTNAIYVQCVDDDATFQWAFKISAGQWYYNAGRAIVAGPQGRLCIAGTFQNVNVDFDPGPGISNLSGAGNDDAFLLSLGSVLPTGVDSHEAVAFELHPNPAMEHVYFSERVNGSVVDGCGKVIEQLLNAGSISVAAYPAGLYAVRSEHGGTVRFAVER